MPKSNLYLRLDGRVTLVERRGFKVVKEEELDPKVVLQCLMAVIEEGLSLLETKEAFKNLHKPKKK